MVTLRDAPAAAVGNHQAGRLDEARPAYLSILRALPGHPYALHLLGVLESQLGRPQRAVPLLRRATRTTPAIWRGHRARPATRRAPPVPSPVL